MKFALAGLAFLLTLLPGVAATARSADITAAWSAPATTTIEASEMTFTDGAARLSGTLYAPKGAKNLPAMVAFHPASEPTRDLVVFRHLKQMLPPLGMAVFVFDRRGSGKSGTESAEGDYEALADDGIAAQKMLARDPRIDPKRIGFWGLSQGGWLALLAASRSPQTAFAIAVSAPMTTPDVQMIFAVANILRIEGYSQHDIDIAVAARKAVDDFERGKLDRATAQKRLDAAIAKPWFDRLYMSKTFHDPAQSGWAKEIKNDPLATLPKVKVPTLIIYGAKDPWVPAKLSEKILKANAAKYPNITTAVIAGADHDMMFSMTPKQQVDPKGFNGLQPEAPEYFALLASWLTIHGFAHPDGASAH
jgi:dipeptidyl aminopeptidase/acylaminoacyl peptidase